MANAAEVTRPWPADKVERWPLDRLIPNARNARTHSPEQIAQLAGAMREWGWTMPILVDEQGGIIAGHGRVLAARQLGIEEAPVMVALGWTEAQKRAYMLADNKLAINAGWDEAMLAVELSGLAQAGFDIGLTGFSADELDAMINAWNIDPSIISGEETFEGVDRRIVVLVSQSDADNAIETIKGALESADIAFTLH